MQSYGHYIFPDPGLFIHPATAAKYIESWLRVHDAWFMCVAKEPSLALSNQSWRTFLSIDNTIPEKGATKAARVSWVAVPVRVQPTGTSGYGYRLGLSNPGHTRTRYNWVGGYVCVFYFL